MQVTVKLHASLRPYGRSDSDDGLFPLETTEKATVCEVIRELGIPPEKVRMILLNGRGVDSNSSLSNGDRIALFPPEMAFNMYVALSFRRDLAKKNLDQEGN
jgi:molybdopterin converting factor small subunit